MTSAAIAATIEPAATGLRCEASTTAARQTSPQQSPGAMALQATIRRGDFGGARALINDWEGSLDDVDEEKMTALSWASKAGSTDLVRLLLERGAKSTADVVVGGQGPMVAAALNGHIDVADLLLDGGVYVDLTTRDTPLARAAGAGYYDMVNLLLSRGANINTTSGQAPLSYAAQKGHLEIVKLLVENSAFPDRPDQYGQTPMCDAAANGHIEVVEFLFWRGANPDLPDKDGLSPLSFAVRNGKTDVVEFLTKNGADISSSAGQRLLSLATESGHMEVVRCLVDRGVMPNFLSPESSKTPLSIAAEKGHSEIVQFLVRRGADPNFLVDDRQTPLYLAASSGSNEIVKFLIQNNANPNVFIPLDRVPVSLIYSIDYTDFAHLLLGKIPQDHFSSGVPSSNTHDAIKELINTGDDLSDGPHILSWILWAVRYGFEQLFIYEGVTDWNKIYIYNAQRQAPLSLAVQYGHSVTVEAILAGDTDTNMCCVGRKNEGRTPLSFAAESGSLHITELLLNHGADPNIKSAGENWKGQIPLSIAAAEGHWEVVERLLSAACPDPNFEDTTGRTPIWWAASCGHANVVEKLLQYGAIADSHDRDGLTALSVAASNGHEQAVRQLIHHSSLSLKDKNGRTALWRAILNGQSEVANILMKKDVTTLHCLVEANDLSTAEILLRAGYNVEQLDTKGLTPLRLALHLCKPDFARLFMRYSASSRGIQAKEWLGAFPGYGMDILELSKLQNGSAQFHLIPENSVPTFHDVKTSILLDRDGTSWTAALFRSAPPSEPAPYKLQISSKSSGYQEPEMWISLQFPSTESHNSTYFGFPGLSNLTVGWKAPVSAKGSAPVQPTVCLSSLQYIWIPEDEIDLFVQFLESIRERWIEICNLVGERLVKSTDIRGFKRLDQLRAEGRSLEMMRRLAKDSQRLMNLRVEFRNQLQISRSHITTNGEHSSHKDYALELLLDIESRINNRLSDLEITLKELLQIEFAWAAITESRISTSLGQNVMLLTYVSIFYLPLAFCAALWAIPNLADRATLNSFVVTSVVVGLVTLLVAFNLENIISLIRSKTSQWRAKIIKKMHTDERWKTEADELQSSLQTRSSPSEWLLVIFWLSRLMQKLKWQRGTRQGQPRARNVLPWMCPSCNAAIVHYALNEAVGSIS
ncbi:hypothetical protein G7054_g7332 [Neopestalotiopsis clavispora]|nr:hypothetical protein G7054_g7332 [Neopestalotiopsis clavispora]